MSLHAVNELGWRSNNIDPDEQFIDPDELFTAELCVILLDQLCGQGGSRMAKRAQQKLATLIREARRCAQDSRNASSNSSPEQLDSDVAKILGQPILVALIGQGRTISPVALRQAWGEVDELHRDLFRWRYCFDGDFACRPYIAVGILCGMSDAQVKRKLAETIAQLKEALLPTHGFPGLCPPVLNKLLEAGVSTLDGLTAEINQILLRPGWGPGTFNLLVAWLATHRLSWT